MVGDVVARGLDIVDLGRIERVEPMLALADEKQRVAGVRRLGGGGERVTLRIAAARAFASPSLEARDVTTIIGIDRSSGLVLMRRVAS